MSKIARPIRLATAVASGLLVVAAAGCSTPAPTPAAPTASTAVSAPAGTPPAASASASAAPPASAAPSPSKTAAGLGDLRDALLRQDEVGSGLVLVTKPGSPPADFFRSSDASCRDLVKIMNRSDRQSSTKGVARATYVDENGPTTFVESIEKHPSKAAAAQPVAELREGTQKCQQVTVKFTEKTSSSAKVSESQLPGQGDDSAATLVVLTSGSLKGFSFVFSTTQLGAVELRTFSVALPIDPATAKITKAVTKAKKALS